MAKRPVFGVVGVPTFGNVSVEWAFNLHHMGVGLAVYVSYMFIKNQRVDHAKQKICEAAVEQDADWVFLLDDDVIPPTNTLMKMNKMAFGPPYLDVINGVYFSKSNPPVPLMFRGDLKGSFWNWHVGDVVKIDAAGAGCTFIKTSVLKALPKPWFSVDYTYNADDPKDFPPPAAGATEDLYFYKKVRDAGFQTWADTSIQCVHEDRKSGTYFQLPSDYPQAIPGSEIKPRGKKLILDIGSGKDTPYFPEGVPVRLDNDENNNPDIIADWNNIPEPDQKYDIVFASHALEHNPHKKVLNVLREWSRVLKVGGELRIVVPNLQYVAERLYHDKELDARDMWILYSAQKDGGKDDLHKVGFTPRLLREAVEKLGFYKDIKVWTSNGNWSNWKDSPGNYNILLSAKKVKHPRTSSIADDSLNTYSPEESEKHLRKKYEIGADIPEPQFNIPGKKSATGKKKAKTTEDNKKTSKRKKKSKVQETKK